MKAISAHGHERGELAQGMQAEVDAGELAGMPTETPCELPEVPRAVATIEILKTATRFFEVGVRPAADETESP